MDAVLQRKGDWMTYDYDFGDSWTHRVVLETMEEGDAARSAVIEAGKGACPPEDCGGVGGYARVVYASMSSKSPCATSACLAWRRGSRVGRVRTLIWLGAKASEGESPCRLRGEVAEWLKPAVC